MHPSTSSDVQAVMPLISRNSWPRFRSCRPTSSSGASPMRCAGMLDANLRSAVAAECDPGHGDGRGGQAALRRPS